jgi:hypothetical protein
MPAFGGLADAAAGNFIRLVIKYTFSFKQDITRSGTHDTRQCPQHGGFTRAVRAQHHNDFILGDFHVNPFYGADNAVIHHQILYLQQIHSTSSSSTPK